MKKSILVFAALAACVAFAEDWIYNPETHYVTDGVWTFYATADDANGTIAFGRVVDDATTGMAVPTALTDVDFSKPVRTADSSKSYTIVQFGNSETRDQGVACGLFGYFGQHQDDAKSTTVAGLVGKLTLPGEGLVMVGNAAFNGCVNMTGAVSFPSTVTTVGRFAFKNSKISGDIKLLNVTQVGSSAFLGTAITSAEFGPDLTSMDGNGQSGVFASCTSLTNVVFDATANTTFKGGGMFYSCSSLKKVDLTGVTKILLQTDNNPYYSHFGSSAVEEIFLSDRLETLTACAFSGANNLSALHFFGMPPTTLNTPVLKDMKAGAIITTYVHLDADDSNYAAQKAAWDVLTESGAIAESGSCWKSDMIDVTTTYRPLVLYKEQQKGDVGYWVFSGGKVRGGGWEFDATSQGDLVKLTTCTAWPEGVEEVDFTKRLTDADGIEYFFGELSTFVDNNANWTWGDGPIVPTVENLPEPNKHLGSLILPTNGLHTIGVKAFANCLNLMNIENCFPDTLTSVGEMAFFNCPFPAGQGDVKLRGLVSLEKNIFTGSKATSVEFGKPLTTIKTAWGGGAFDDCSELTNVVFSPESKISKFEDNNQDFGPFRTCPKLVGDNGMMDIRAFTKLPIFCPFADAPLVTGLTCGTNLTKMSSNFFKAGYGKIQNLNKVVFLGPPPTNLNEITDLFTYYAKDRELVCEIPLQYRNEWNAFCEQGMVQNKKTYWKSQYVGGDDYKNVRLLICPDAPSPLGITIIFH